MLQCVSSTLHFAPLLRWYTLEPKAGRRRKMAEFVRTPNAMIALSHVSKEEEEDAGGNCGGGGGGGGSASSVGSGRKPRGRPPGSKNKPKPPVVITRESESAMHPVILELSAGSDVLESVSTFARRRRVGVSVLSGSGAVANVALRHPTSQTSTITLSGRFDILSLAGTFLPPHSTATFAKSPFTISLAGSQGQVIGGTVAGALTAAGTVVVVAASFVNMEFHRLPLSESEDEEVAVKEEEEVQPAGLVTPVVGPSNPLAGHQLAHDMVLWATPSSSRGPHHPPHSHHPPPPPHHY